MPTKDKSARQVRYLLSDGSPLTQAQKAKLKGELHSGAVRVKKHRRKKSIGDQFTGRYY